MMAMENNFKVGMEFSTTKVGDDIIVQFHFIEPYEKSSVKKI